MQCEAAFCSIDYLFIVYFLRFRAICWKNARFSILPSGTYKQVNNFHFWKKKKSVGRGKNKLQYAYFPKCSAFQMSPLDDCLR